MDQNINKDNPTHENEDSLKQASKNRFVSFLAKHNISLKEMIIYILLFLFFTSIIVWKLVFSQTANNAENNVAQLENPTSKVYPQSNDPSKPWDRYISNSEKETELKKLASDFEELTDLEAVVELLQANLESYGLELGFVGNSTYGNESKKLSEREVEHLKTFGIVLLDEISKYQVEAISSIGLDTILLSNGSLSSGNRTGLNGLADYEHDAVIYNVTSLLTESNGRQQFNPTWEKYVRQLIQHEIGHFSHDKLDLTDINYPESWSNWSNLNPPEFSYLMSCENANPLVGAAAPIPKGFVTANATTCPTEDWADTLAALMGESGVAGIPSDDFFKAKQTFIKEKLIILEPTFEKVFER